MYEGEGEGEGEGELTDWHSDLFLRCSQTPTGAVVGEQGDPQ